MSRYEICYALDNTGYVRMTTYATVEAESAVAARMAFLAKHPGKYVVYVRPARPDAFQRIGAGAWTDEEWEEHKRKLQANYNAQRRRAVPALEKVMAVSLEEFAAREAYKERRAAEQTPNAEGIHVGDMFAHMFGYSMTCWTFYQVVGLKGKHTIIVKENDESTEEYDCGQGYCRPIRDKFRRDIEYTVRTGYETDRYGKTVLKVRPPQTSETWARMHPFAEGGYKEFDHLD